MLRQPPSPPQNKIAEGFNANFIPQNFGVLPDSTAVDDIFVFTNFTQGNVLASAPHPAGPTIIIPIRTTPRYGKSAKSHGIPDARHAR